jgi:hypothetical protein
MKTRTRFPDFKIWFLPLRLIVPDSRLLRQRAGGAQIKLKLWGAEMTYFHSFMAASSTFAIAWLAFPDALARWEKLAPEAKGL